VPAGDRGNYPAFLVQSWRRIDGSATGTLENNFGVATNYYYDDSLAKVFPQREAVTWDNSPPPRCNHLCIHHNRLFLMDEETIYWSDPFSIDSFSGKATTNYIRLNRAKGGRNMGCVEFGDQVVLFTENQTWGLTNVDLDVPNLYPIALGIGCVAPDSVAVVDGVLVWLAENGVYAWDGGRDAPVKVSGLMEVKFGKMNYSTHGGSRATGHNRRYDVALSNPDYSSQGTSHRLNLDTFQWAKLNYAAYNSIVYPLATIYAPLGNNDAGAMHPVWGKVDYDTGAADYGLYLGELTTQDNGTDFTCSCIMQFP